MITFNEWIQQNHPNELDEGLLDTAKWVGRTAKATPAWAGRKVASTLNNVFVKPYKMLRNQYGDATALAILAASLGLHTVFPILAALPASMQIGSIPGIITADAIQFLRGKETLIAKGVQKLKTLDKHSLTKLFKKTQQDIANQPQPETQPAPA